MAKMVRRVSPVYEVNREFEEDLALQELQEPMDTQVFQEKLAQTDRKETQGNLDLRGTRAFKALKVRKK